MVDPSGFCICRKNATHSDDCVRADGDSWADNSMSTNPRSFADVDLSNDKSERRILVIMVASKQAGTLRDAGVRPDLHVAEVIDPCAFADPHVMPDDKAPRVFDVDARFDDCASTDLCSEQPKHGTLELGPQMQPTVEE